MNTSTLDFTSRLDPEETKYTNVSLEYLKDSILSALDIVEVAQKLGINLQKLRKNSKEQKNYSTSNIYVGNCPRCREKWKLRVFTQYQTFWCLSCHWEWELTDNMNIFQLLTHHDESYSDGFWMNYETNKKKIMRLFELFPKELAFLQWKNLNRYEYSWDYLSAAEGYYPWIKQDLEKVWARKHRLEKYRESLRESEDLKNNTILLCRSSDKIYKLNRIIAGYAITSQIYSRREEVNKIVQEQSISQILWNEGIDEFTEWNIKLQTLTQNYKDSEAEESLLQFFKEEKEREEVEKKRIQDEGNVKIKAERLAEEQRIQELARAKKENPSILLNELMNASQERSEFFEKCHHDMICEWNSLLELWNFGKFVLVFQPGTLTFSVVFGKNKVESPVPSSLKDALYLTLTTNLPWGAGFHKDISIPEWSKRNGWAQYIILPENTILIGGESGDYGSVSKEIVEKCLCAQGYTVYFLDNTDYQSLNSIFTNITAK